MKTAKQRPPCKPEPPNMGKIEQRSGRRWKELFCIRKVEWLILDSEQRSKYD